MLTTILQIVQIASALVGLLISLIKLVAYAKAQKKCEMEGACQPA